MGQLISKFWGPGATIFSFKLRFGTGHQNYVTSVYPSFQEDGIDFAVGNMEYIQFMEHLVGRGLIEQLESRDRQHLWQVYYQLQDELTIWEEFHQMERPPIAIHFEQMADKINDGSIYTGEQRRIRRVRPPKGRGGRLGRRAIRYRAK